MKNIAPRLAGSRALVTGASTGIGRAVAIRFAAEGASVAINYAHSSKAAEDTCAMAHEASFENGHKAARHVIVKADVAKGSDVKAMFDMVVTAFDGLDILVNNAGIQSQSPSEHLDIAAYQRILDVNLTGAVLCAQAALERFILGDVRGTIINCSSVHQIIPKPGYLAYSISKGGLANLTRTLALEFASRGIRVNAVAPGAIETPINASWTGDAKAREEVVSHIPLGRVGEPSEIAGIFAFLASSEAAYITGQTIYACGGLTLFNEFKQNWSS
jgi:glucose 1-dehydrogenase